MKVFLGDLVHTWKKVSVWTVPLNVGFVGAYARANVEDLDVRIFKEPLDLLAAIERERPEVVALGVYAWNENLNGMIFRRAKEIDRNILTVAGGPTFTTVNGNEAGGRAFFSRHPSCDIAVVDQGEKPFVELLRRLRAVGGDVETMRAESVPSCLTNDLAANDRVLVGPRLAPIDNLDDIPSPYLTGLLDPFLEGTNVPLLETNRSCPYQCTYCALAVSTGGKLKTFSLERVFGEIDYIAARTRADYLILTDANFGILERDVQIGEKLHGTHIEHNYPGYMCVVWNKGNAERVKRTARALGGLAQVGASMQSMHPDVLKAIKRRNLAPEVASQMSRELRSDGMGFFSELIAGLPMQTLNSHLDDNRALMDMGAEIYNYGLRLLTGTEMDTAESRREYIREVGWRLQDSAYGIYDGEPVFEGEEMVLATSTMSAADMHSLRFLHFLFQYMWGKQLVRNWLIFLQKAGGLHPVDVMLACAERFKTDDGPMGALYRDFDQDHALEKFATYEEMCAYWREPANLERLARGEVGKLNASKGYELVRQLASFTDFLRPVQDDLLAKHGLERLTGPASALLTLAGALAIPFAQVARMDIPPRRLDFDHDVLAWIDGHDPAVLESRRPVTVELHVEERRLDRMQRARRFFEHENLELMLRQMFDTNPRYFFYDMRPAPMPELV